MKENFNVFELLTPKSSVHYIQDDSTIRQALEKIAFHKFTVIPLLNKDGEYVGTLSEGDILRYLLSKNVFSIDNCEDFLIGEIEKYRSYKSVKNTASFDEIYEASLLQNFIPVVDDRNIFVGIIKRKEIMEFMKNNILASGFIGFQNKEI